MGKQIRVTKANLQSVCTQRTKLLRDFNILKLILCQPQDDFPWIRRLIQKGLDRQMHIADPSRKGRYGHNNRIIPAFFSSPKILGFKWLQ